MLGLGTDLVDLSMNRLIAEADAAKHLVDVRSEELARVRKERDAALREAEERFNDGNAVLSKARERLMGKLADRGLLPA